MTDESVDLALDVAAGIAAAPLIADPKEWINRRVETIQLLSQEETRRKVSVDFSLTDEQLEDLTTADGVVVPISALTKEARRNFDLRDESGRSVPVLGRMDNGYLAHVALMSAAANALPDDVPNDEFETLTADFREITFGAPNAAYETVADFAARASDGDTWREYVWADPTCQSLFFTLWANYVLFAVLDRATANRRVLKYSYGEYFDLSRGLPRLRELMAPREIPHRVWRPDRRRFEIACPGAWRAASFHMEIAIPEELRINTAMLVDIVAEASLGTLDEDVDRAALYAETPIDEHQDVRAWVEVSPERVGLTSRSATIAVAVATMLWVGVVSELDASNPGPAVSILLAGAALFSGISAGAGEHRLVRVIFRTSRRWLGIVAVAALVGSVSLAMEIPSEHPVGVWSAAAVASTVAAARLLWSAVRAPT
jgi:hypothetical protein